MRAGILRCLALVLVYSLSSARAFEIVDDKAAVTKDHHTDKYRNAERKEFPLITEEIEPLHERSIVLRRGGSAFRARHEGGAVRVSVPEGCDPSSDGQWLSSQIKRGEFSLEIPPTTPVGSYRIENDDDEEPFEIIVLFNPYDADRTDVGHLEEYIEREDGLLFTGSIRDHSGMLFYFEQFKASNLRVTLHLLSGLNAAARSDPVSVSRHLSHIIMRDVCYGYWPKDDDSQHPFYKNAGGGYKCKNKSDKPKESEKTRTACRAPDDWAASTEILEQYWARHELKSSRVQYCQCYIFAALLTTCGRTLGIPSRPVSNFRSAHDENYNRAIEEFYLVEGTKWTEPDDSYRAEACAAVAAYSEDSDPKNLFAEKDICAFPHESVWDFHAWTEMAMTRPDLGDAKYDGWQVVDATHQEFSYHDKFENGPTPVRAVYENDDLCYDGEFVITEVKADTILWVKKEGKAWTRYTSKTLYPDGRLKFLYDNPENTPGSKLITKKVGDISDECMESDCRNMENDLTYEYKSRTPYKAQCKGKHRTRCGPGDPSTPGSGAPDRDTCAEVRTVSFLQVEDARSSGIDDDRRRRKRREPSPSSASAMDIDDPEEGAHTSKRRRLGGGDPIEPSMSVSPPSVCAEGVEADSMVVFLPLSLTPSDPSHRQVAFDTAWRAAVRVVNCGITEQRIGMEATVYVKNYDGTRVIYKDLRGEGRHVYSVVAHRIVRSKRIAPGETQDFFVDLDLDADRLRTIGIDRDVGTTRYLEIDFMGSVAGRPGVFEDEFHKHAMSFPIRGSASVVTNADRARMRHV